MRAFRRTGTADACLRDALQVLGPEPLVGLSSCPSRWDILSLVEATALPGDCFELQAFSPAGQLTWRRAGGSEDGGALLLVADAALEPLAGRWSEEPLPTGIEVLAHQHLLWGTASTSRPGWTAMHEARIDGFEVPFDAAGHERLVLEAEELVGFDADGNAMVLYERLVRFAPASTRRNGDRHA